MLLLCKLLRINFTTCSIANTWSIWLWLCRLALWVVGGGASLLRCRRLSALNPSLLALCWPYAALVEALQEHGSSRLTISSPPSHTSAGLKLVAAAQALLYSLPCLDLQNRLTEGLAQYRVKYPSIVRVLIWTRSPLSQSLPVSFYANIARYWRYLSCIQGDASHYICYCFTPSSISNDTSPLYSFQYLLNKLYQSHYCNWGASSHSVFIEWSLNVRMGNHQAIVTPKAAPTTPEEQPRTRLPPQYLEAQGRLWVRLYCAHCLFESHVRYCHCQMQWFLRRHLQSQGEREEKEEDGEEKSQRRSQALEHPLRDHEKRPTRRTTSFHHREEILKI